MWEISVERTRMDKERLRGCVERVYRDAAGAMTSGLAYLGVRTGLFDAMAGQGPMTVETVVRQSGLAERYVREWLHGMVAAGYLDYDATAATFELPPEHAYLFASFGTDHYVGGLFEGIPGLLQSAPGVANAFSDGGGVPFSDFHPDVHASIDTMNRGIYQHRLVKEWIAGVPGIAATLEAGGRGLDLGCGVGTVTITLAKAYPAGRFVGVDLHEQSIERAVAAALAANVADRTEFHAAPIDSLPDGETYQLITAFDCVHDLAAPLDVLNAVRRRLAPDGTFLVLEPKSGDRLEDNVHPIGAMFYGFSMFHCMTQSLAAGGPGLGACLGPAGLERLVREAGFTRFDPAPIRSPVNLLYAVGH